MNEAYAVSIVLALAGIGLALSLLSHRTTSTERRSPWRCIAGMVGGLAFLAQIIWMGVWTALLVSGTLAVLVAIVRIPKMSRESPTDRPGQSWAEVSYAFSGTASIAVAWGISGDRWLAFVPIAFMAWGDNIAGLARSTVWKSSPGSQLPSLCMLAICLACSLLFDPWWIGAVAAIMATVAERYRPRFIRWCDDNPIIVATSLGTMALLLEVID